MNMKKIATMATCMALVGAVAVGGTLALMAQETEITNTFMVGAGFPGGEDGDGKAYFYVDEVIAEMDEDTGNWVANTSGTRTHEDQTYGEREGHTGWKVVADSTLVKDPMFHVNEDVDGAENAPAAFVVAKLGTIPDGFVPTSVNGTTGWYELKITTSGDEVTGAELGDQVIAGTTLSANKYYVFKTALDVTGTADTDALFDTVKVGSDVTENNYTLPVYGVAIEVPSEGATLDNNKTLEEVASAAYTALPKTIE